MGDSALLSALQVLTFISSIAMGLSPFPEIYRVHKRRAVGDVSIFPVAMLFGNSYLWTIYAYLIGNFFPLFSVTAFAAFMAIVFSAVFFWWSTTERRRFYKVWGWMGAGLIAITLYIAIAVSGATGQSQHQVISILGYLSVAMTLVLKLAPLETINLIVKTKNASTMPVTMSAVAFINGSLWVWTCTITGDMFVLTPNVAGAALGLIQVVLYVIYRPSKAGGAAKAASSRNEELSLCAKSECSVCTVSWTPPSENKQPESPVYIAIDKLATSHPALTRNA